MDSREANNEVTIKGETHTVKEWAQIVGLPLRAMLLRYTRYKESGDGNRFVAAPGKGRSAKVERPKPQIKNGGRKAIVHAFYEAVENEIAPLIRKDIKEYLETGKYGKALQLLKDFQRFIPVDSKEIIEPQKKATFGLIIQEPPGTFTKQED